MPIDQLTKRYDTLADQMVETLFDSHLDLEQFLPALAAAMESRVKSIKADADDYWIADLNWADHQERDTKLLLSGLKDAIDDLSVVDLPADIIDLARVKRAASTLLSLKRRMETCR